MAVAADPAYLCVDARIQQPQSAVVVMGGGAVGATEYRVGQLYIVNGELMHRDLGLNTPLGKVGLVMPTGAKK